MTEARRLGILGGESSGTQEDQSMRSPFPGMDPYIEARGLWGDFHHGLITDIRRALSPHAPPQYFLRLRERSYHVLAGEESKKTHALLPDVSVTAPHKTGKNPGRKKEQWATAVAQPGVPE